MSEEDLLQLYLTINREARHERFADTRRAAEIWGISQRTVQLWIEMRHIRAVPIGKKYQVDLVSLRNYIKNQLEKHSQ